MLKVVTYLRILSITLPVVVFGLTAAPNIEVDNAYYDAGTIMEGTTEKISHTFIIKNTGDDTLVIEKVKPG